MMPTLKKALALCAVLLATLLLMEGLSYLVLKLWAAQSSAARSETHLFDAHRDHRLNPDFAFADDPKAQIHSPDGFRSDTPVALAKAPGAIRIIALGTSALYGLSAGPPYPAHRALYNTETITAHIQTALNERLEREGLSARVEVINAGVSAYTSFHHVVHMLSRLIHYRPDVVINIDGHNDFYGDRPGDRWNGYNYSTGVLVDELNGRSLALPLFTFVRALAPHSNLFALLEKLAKRLWQSHKVQGNTLPNTPKLTFPAPANREQGIRDYARQSYLRDLQVIHDLGLREGYAHLIFAQPELILEDDRQLSESDRALKAITLAHQPDPKHMSAVQPMLRALFAEAGLTFHDLTRIGPRNPEGRSLYIDYCHLTPDGAEILGRAIAEIMAPGIIKRARGLSGSKPGAARPAA